MPLNATVARVTDRIIERSRPLRRDYLDRMARAREAGTSSMSRRARGSSPASSPVPGSG